MKKRIKEPVAVIGMACRFPGGAENPGLFWELLTEKRDAITEVDNNRWSKDYYYHPNHKAPGKTYVNSAGQLDNVYNFEPEFFGLTPRQAVQMDPQQRLLLELTWEALEDGGQLPERLAGTDTSVFFGISSLDYANSSNDDPALADQYFMTGNTLSMAANRISHRFDLKGGSAAIDTACSSSLVALHQACTSIWSGESSTSITGGMHLLFSPYPFIGFSRASMLSPDGQCRVFDAHANGYVRSEGGALFILKPLKQAELDGDCIHAVILNTGINTDGAAQALSVPDSKTQQALLERVYREIDIDTNSVCYIEAHGTGTVVGDPIEANTIGAVMGVGRDPARPILTGSVKSNLGHLEPASGAAGMMKTILALKHRGIPASIHYQTPNPAIPFNKLNLRVVDNYLSLEDQPAPLVMGVNSFGFGGTNAHVVLQEYTGRKDNNSRGKPGKKIPPLYLSANSVNSLKQKAAQFISFLEQTEDTTGIYHICYSAAMHRQRLKHGLVAHADNREELIDALKDYCGGKPNPRWVKAEQARQVRKIAFVFSGNGGQWYGMAHDLFHYPLFTETVKEVDKYFARYQDWSVFKELHAGEEESRLEFTEIAQPCLFALQVGLVHLLDSYGIRADLHFGHSIGEVSAAYAAGVITLEQAVKIIHCRSAAQGKTKGMGKMAAAHVDYERAWKLIEEVGPELELAAINSPKSVTFSGPAEKIALLQELLAEEQIFCKVLNLDYAFHSVAMDSIRSEFLNELGKIECINPVENFISTSDNQSPIGPLDAQYWWRNLRQPVQFYNTVDMAIQEEVSVFIEIGPSVSFSTYIRECCKEANHEGVYVGCLDRRKHNQAEKFLNAVYELTLINKHFDLDPFFPVPGKYVPLPAYPWDRKPYVFTPTNESINRQRSHPLLGYRSNQFEGQWTNQVDLDTHPFLRDHVVDSTAIFPAAGFIEMALAAGREHYENNAYEVFGLEIRSPLVLEEGLSKDTRFILSSDDNSFKILSRDRLTNQDWQLHVVGQFMSCEHISASQNDLDIERLLSESENHITGDEVYDAASRLGLDYGPLFRRVETVDVTKGGLLATLNQISTDAPDYLVFPGQIDAVFHALFPATGKIDQDQQAAYLPVSFASIRHYPEAGAARYALVDIHKVSGKSIEADFSLLAENGKPVLHLRQCLLKSLRLKHAEEIKRLKTVQMVADRHSINDKSPLPSLNHLLSSLEKSQSNKKLKDELTRYHDEILPLLKALAVSIARETLDLLGAVYEPFDLDALIERAGIDYRYRPLLEYLCKLLVQYGKASAKNGLYQLINADTDIDSETIWRTLLADFPDQLPNARVIASSLLRLSDVILNKSEMSEDQAKDSIIAEAGCRVCNVTMKLLQGLLEQVLAVWPSHNRRFRIAEFIDAHSLPRRSITNLVNNDFCDYHYFVLDADKFMTLRDQTRHEKHVTVEHLDLDKFDIPDDFCLAAFDMVIANDVFNRQPHVDYLLKICNQISASNGLLFIAESQPDPISDMLGELQEAWADIDAPSARFNKRNAVDWLAMLGETTEFQHGIILSNIVYPASMNYALLAQRDAHVREEIKDNQDRSPGLMLLIASEDTRSGYIANTIQRTLAAQGILSRIMDSRKLQDCPESFMREVEHIVYLSPMNQDTSMKYDGSLPLYQLFCDDLLHLLHKVQDDNVVKKTSLWLATKNANRVENTQEDTAVIPDMSTIWGMNRVIQNEMPELTCHTIDIQGKAVDVAQLIVDEILNEDEETEIILKDGVRYVNRLREIHNARKQEVVKLHDDSQYYQVKLAMNESGKLSELTWEKEQRPLLQAGKIEIAVKSVGLNYRDVMYASGMLSDELLEDGFAGPTLGLECSGIVSRVFDDNSNFFVGDPVVAFSPASFASHIITDEIAVFPKPENWSFEDAATVPAAFFTVYYALSHLARLQEGEKILIHGAAGGVGLAAIQYASFCGAEIYATAGTDEKRAFLKALGVDHVLNSRNLSYADDINQLTDGNGVDVILNSLAGEAVDKNLAILKPFGRFIELGKRDFLLNKKLGIRPFRNNISYFGVDADQLLKHQPRLCRKLFREMLDLFNSGDMRPMPYTRFNAADISDAFRLMQESRHIGKVVVTMQDIIPVYSRSELKSNKLTLGADGSYLVTGGLGGFGFASAQWLAQKGAKHIALLSRSGQADESMIDKLEALKQGGVDVRQIACDVSDSVSLAKVFRAIEADMPPLKGIIHSAMVLDDKLIRDMDSDSLQRVFSPKVDGAWHLHALTRNMDLDFFVLYSSATTCIGNPGQCNYVAANSYLESLAHYRRHLGLPALAVSWDAITDVGYLTRNPELKTLMTKQLGILGISSEQAFEHLEDLILSQTATAAVIKPNFATMRRLLPIASSPLFTELVLGITDYELKRESMDIYELIKDATPEETHIIISELLVGEISEVLQIAEDRIDHNVSLQDLGVDSLMAVELIVRLEERFDMKLPVMAIANSTTIESLASRIIRNLSQDQGLMTSRDGHESQEKMLARTLSTIHSEVVSEEEIEAFVKRYSD